MARRRYLSTKISLDTRVNRLAMTAGDFAALLYTWMIPHAEDDARLTGDPEELLITVCPARRDKTAEDIATALQAMHDLGLVVWNRQDVYVQFPGTFYGYQSYIKSRKPAQDEDYAPSDNEDSAKQRKTAQKVPSFSSSFSFKSSSSLRSPKSAKAKAQPSTVTAPTARDAADLASHLRARILASDEATKVPPDTDLGMSKWTAEIDRMIRIDNRDPAEIRAVIDFSTSHSFWRNQILSANSLRSKYDQLNRTRKGQSNGKQQGATTKEPEPGSHEWYAKRAASITQS